MTTPNPFPKSGFFATPESPYALLEYCETLTGTEKALAVCIAAMAMNLAHEMYEQATKGETK